VITLPLGVLQAGAVAFDPPLPERKQRAIQRLGMGDLEKTWLRFPEVFWDEVEFIGYAGDRVGEWASWLNASAYLNEPVLMGFNFGRFGRELAAQPDAAVLSGASETLRSLYGPFPRPDGWLQTRWAADPFALGSYSYLPVGSSPDDRAALAEPVGGRLFFAGEATALDFPSTVHGALMSGWCTAQELAL
jgi:monoamine oxidase